MDVDGITYKDIYYILPHVTQNLRLHFHELVHVAQWANLGAASFIVRYITEIRSSGYAEAPLEKMAYTLDTHFSNGGVPIDIPRFVSEKYNNHLNFDAAKGCGEVKLPVMRKKFHPQE